MNIDEKGLVEKLLENSASRIGDVNAIVGLDGFIDEIVHVVDKRIDADNFKRIETINDFAERIKSFSEKSGNVEFVTKVRKIGGNGPIMANAVRALGVPTTYIGNLGYPDVDPVFSDMAKRMKVFTLAAACHTDATEFNDAKIMFGKMEQVNEVTWERILEIVGIGEMTKILNDADLMALVNWSMLPHMCDIWEKLLDKVCPKLDSNKERFVFFDLADPQKREPEDISRMLSLVKRFSEFYKVIFGVNEREAAQIATVIGREDTTTVETSRVEAMCEAISQELGIYATVVHPIHFSVTTINGVTYRQEGPTTPRPKITTGAGDHFNAGFCLGQVLGADPQTSLLMGVCSSGFYVMNAKSATFDELTEFMSSWREDPFGMMG